MNTSPPSTIAQALAHAAQCGLARVDAQILLLHALGQPTHQRAWLIAHDTDVLTTTQQTTWTALCAQRLQGQPVAYLVGHKYFYGLALRVDARVLDPRPDTETLVDWVLALMPCHNTPQRVADLGTGSGAIALAVQHARPQCEVWATDASADALALAQANATQLRLPVRFALGHWLQALAGQFDIIASNPPYIREDDSHLPALRHEPILALTSGADGLNAIRTIIATAPPHLRDGGWLLIEHGWDQAQAVRALLIKQGFTQVQSRKDLAGIERVSGGQWTSVK